MCCRWWVWTIIMGGLFFFFFGFHWENDRYRPRIELCNVIPILHPEPVKDHFILAKVSRGQLPQDPCPILLQSNETLETLLSFVPQRCNILRINFPCHFMWSNKTIKKSLIPPAMREINMTKLYLVFAPKIVFLIWLHRSKAEALPVQKQLWIQWLVFRMKLYSL